MRQFKLLGLAVVAVCVASVALSAFASAAPVILPSEEVERKNTAVSVGATTFEQLGGALKVKCASAPGEGTEEAKGKPLGKFHIMFETCKGTIAGIESVCTGLGEAAGVILVLGTWHLWYDSLSPTLGVATIFLVNAVHFSCASGLTNVEVKGSVVCLDVSPTVKSFKHTFKCEQTAGDPSEVKYWNEAGTEETALLLQSTNGGAFTDSAQGGTGEITATKETFTDNV